MVEMSQPFQAMKYSDFLKELSKILNINLTTIHQSIIDAGTDINKHLNLNNFIELSKINLTISNGKCD